MRPLRRSLLFAGLVAVITMAICAGLIVRTADASAERGNSVAVAPPIRTSEQGRRAFILQRRVSARLPEVPQYHIQVIEPPAGWQGNMPCARPHASFRADMPVLKPQGILGTNVDRLPSVRVIVPLR